MHVSLDDLPFDNRFVRELPADPDPSNRRRQVRGACFSRVMPTEVASPSLLALSPEVAAMLDLSPAELDAERAAHVLAGNRVLGSMEPYAACYGGHQFGNWAGQLGDGRAITLGEVVNRRGERWELQLKGAGPTPYSRRGDGRAVMRSSVREFLCSEAMHHLGVPTTRALSLTATGDSVVRDMLYDGNPREEPGAVVCRVAPTFLRFGSYQIFAARDDREVLRRLLDYTITTFFPELGAPSPDVYVEWLREVSRRTATMIVHWMRVGFVHGVMNTDNMSVLGLTIDYGPYGWLEGYDPSWTPNTTDAARGRYRFGNQPSVAFWNLVQLANALLPIVEETAPLEAALGAYADTYESELAQMLDGKLGIDAGPAGEGEDGLADELLSVLQLTETDMTIFFRRLAEVPTSEEETDEARLAPLRDAYYAPDELAGETLARVGGWLRRYAARVREQGRDPETRRATMNANNPKYVLRNYLAQLAIDDAERGDPAKLIELLDVLRRPYDEQPDRERYAAKRPEWARHRVGCSMLSCSS